MRAGLRCAERVNVGRVIGGGGRRQGLHVKGLADGSRIIPLAAARAAAQQLVGLSTVLQHGELAERLAGSIKLWH